MVIKTMKKGYVNLAKYSDFIIRHKQEEFAVIAMEPARKGYGQYAASVELGRYPSETEAHKALEAMMKHWDAIKEAEYYGAENNIYVSNVFTMPESSKNKTEEFQTFTINGQNYTVPSKVIKEIHRQDMINIGKEIVEKRRVVCTMHKKDPDWEPDDAFYYTLASMVKKEYDSLTDVKIDVENAVIYALQCSVEREEDEKRYAAKVDFVVKYLLEVANNQELNDFMGKDTDEAVLYNETDIRDVIAQMPELEFFDYYYKFNQLNFSYKNVPLLKNDIY